MIENLLHKGEKYAYVKDFENRFVITSFGRLFSINGKWKGIKELSPCVDGLGYKSATLRAQPKKKNFRIHTLVAEHFLQRLDHHECVNHLDGNKLNNNVSNLEWTTYEGNSYHCFNVLHDYKGSKHHNSKLSESDVFKIRWLYANEGLTHKEIGLMFGVGRRHIGDIINKVCWSHI